MERTFEKLLSPLDDYLVNEPLEQWYYQIPFEDYPLN